MKKINEREMLPILRSAVTGDAERIRSLMEVLIPILNEIVQKGETIKEYKGWAYDLTIINSQPDCTHNHIKLDNLSYQVVSEGKDDYSFRLSVDIVIKVHFHSFLWNF